MRKCWNCGQPTNDENSRVCSDEICQRAEKKSSNGEFRNKALVKQHEKNRAYHQRPERKAKQREYYQRPEIKAKRRKYEQRPEVKAKRREYNQRPEVKERRREYQRKYTQRPERKASESRERMKKAMQDLGMTKELKLYFGEE